MSEPIDQSFCQPYEGVVTAAARARSRGLRPFKLGVSPMDYRNIQFGCKYLHEYIDEEERSYLVVRIPERLLVYVDLQREDGKAQLHCEAPDCKIEVLLAY